MLDPTITLKVDLLTRKVEAFILVPKCTKTESLVKMCPIFLLLARYVPNIAKRNV